MAILKQELNKILNIIPKNSKIAYLDYPVYSNIGDILIWKGAERFFSEHNINVRSQNSFRDFSSEIKFPSNVILVFQGGGNLGDLYPEPQEMREYCIKNFKKHTIVILPQTVYFKNPKALEHVSGIFSKHQDLHLFVRDKLSYNLAKKNLCDNVYLTPDMAHALWPIHPTTVKNPNRLLLLRRDIERGPDGCIKPNSGDYILDWPQFFTSSEKTEIKILIDYHSIKKRVQFLPALYLWRLFTRKIVKRVIKLFSEYASIVSSRLHGHILACIMNKSNIFLNNSYGKNLTYYKTWTHRIPYVTFKKCKENNFLVL